MIYNYMDHKFVITRRHGTIIETAEGRSLQIHLRPELLDMNLNKGDQVAIALIEVEKTGEKHILIEKIKQ